MSTTTSIGTFVPTRCPQCGKSRWAIGFPPSPDEVCRCWQLPEAPYVPSYGWVCPRCGRGIAPWKTSCDCVQNYSIRADTKA